MLCHSLLPAFTLTQLVAYLLLWSILLAVIALWKVIDFKSLQVPADDADGWSHLSWAAPIRELQTEFLWGRRVYWKLYLGEKMKRNILGFVPARKLPICSVKWVLFHLSLSKSSVQQEGTLRGQLPVKILFQLLSLRSSFLLKVKVYLRISGPASGASLLCDSI